MEEKENTVEKQTKDRSRRFTKEIQKILNEHQEYTNQKAITYCFLEKQKNKKFAKIKVCLAGVAIIWYNCFFNVQITEAKAFGLCSDSRKTFSSVYCTKSTYKDAR